MHLTEVQMTHSFCLILQILSPNVTISDISTDLNLGEVSTFHFQMMGVNKDIVFSNQYLDEMASFYPIY